MKEIPLTRDMVAIVDDCDYEILSKSSWRAQFNRRITYYAVRHDRFNHNRAIMMHRQIMDCPAGFQVDHIDGNGLNNTRANLRICTQSQNMHNRHSQKNNSSGVVNVHWRKDTCKWYVQIKEHGVRVNLGSFTDINEARNVVNAYRLEYGLTPVTERDQ